MTCYPSHLPPLIPPDLRAELLRNGARGEDHIPVIKLFYPRGAPLWLVTAMSQDGDRLFGLADLGFGCPELGYFSLREITSVQGTRGPLIRRDRRFVARYPLSVYVEAARMAGEITEMDILLRLAAGALRTGRSTH
ncbi:DUF2958 domain-containing protein [Govanella unica]|uniref:DUF2958 domain-containing protein n=1 Tax=Govanella unica TaxID=2975056 RepID=A0A9X3TXU6_9PROT|nr:DUF2958 domain-containing protein [Govania unica]MDA5193694.1 DUF2958 domain-containing protein [Govania unica]